MKTTDREISQSTGSGEPRGGAGRPPSPWRIAPPTAAAGASASMVLGIGVGAGRRLLARVGFAGTFGAVIGALCFQLLGAVLFAIDHTGEPLSASSITRLLAHLLVAIAVAL